MVEAARSHLFNLELRDFSVGSEAEFQAVSNRETVKLAKAFSSGGSGNWGAARKSLNIFFARRGLQPNAIGTLRSGEYSFMVGTADGQSMLQRTV